MPGVCLDGLGVGQVARDDEQMRTDAPSNVCGNEVIESIDGAVDAVAEVQVTHLHESHHVPPLSIDRHSVIIIVVVVVECNGSATVELDRSQTNEVEEEGQ